MGFSKELQRKLDYYEQVFFSLDKPIPFKGGLELHPLKVKEYYDFYNCFPCLTMDKTVKYVPDGDLGRMKKVANIEGISQSYLSYLISRMREEKSGQLITAQLMQLLELVFKIPKGMYCPNCHHEISYKEVFKGYQDFIKQKSDEMLEFIKEQIKNSPDKDNFDFNNIPQYVLDNIDEQAKLEFYRQMQICPECKNKMRDIFSIKTENGINSLMIRNVEINSQEFDEMKAIIPRQNILDYEGDKYINPDLKEELEIKQKLKNQDYTSPTLEKQLICVAIGTGYSLEYLEEMSMRKLAMFLRTIDKKETYYAQLQGQMSGMVKFKEDPKHWIFSDDKYNIAKELTDYGTFEKKFEHVT